MPVTEVVYPPLKQDAENLRNFKANYPKGLEVLRAQPGLEAVYHGFVSEEDGKNVDGETNWLMFPVWEDMSYFHTFVQSEELGKFTSKLMPFVERRSGPEMYETTLSPVASADASVTQIIRTDLGDNESGSAAEEAWKDLVATLHHQSTGGVYVTHGQSVNLEQKKYVGVVGWNEDKVAEIHQQVQDCLGKLRGVGTTSVVVVKLEKF